MNHLHTEILFINWWFLSLCCQDWSSSRKESHWKSHSSKVCQSSFWASMESNLHR
jgi:hypothetical protein